MQYTSIWQKLEKLPKVLKRKALIHDICVTSSNLERDKKDDVLRGGRSFFSVLPSGLLQDGAFIKSQVAYNTMRALQRRVNQPFFFLSFLHYT